MSHIFWLLKLLDHWTMKIHCPCKVELQKGGLDIMDKFLHIKSLIVSDGVEICNGEKRYGYLPWKSVQLQYIHNCKVVDIKLNNKTKYCAFTHEMLILIFFEYLQIIKIVIIYQECIISHLFYRL